MLSMKSTLRGTPLQGRKVASRAVRRPLQVSAYTDWKLEPEPSWCKANQEKCASLDRCYSLSGVISDKMKACLETSLPPEEQRENEKAEFNFLCEQSGIDVAFESRGAAHGLDSPCILSIKDKGSNADVYVDGKRLEKDVSVNLHPGSHVVFGDMHFQVVTDLDSTDITPQNKEILLRALAARNNARLIKEVRRLEAELAHWKMKYGKLHARYKRDHVHKRRQRTSQVTL